jgi:glycine hydroxymethyltransferase
VTTLGMGPAELEEIASIITGILGATVPVSAPDTNGTSRTSKAKFTTQAPAADAARRRVRDVIERFPVYPELDLSIVEPGDFGLTAFEARGASAPA